MEQLSNEVFPLLEVGRRSRFVRSFVLEQPRMTSMENRKRIRSVEAELEDGDAQ